MKHNMKFGGRVGIMQGRLCPMVGGRIQAFPAAEWREEFGRAAAIGLSSIEWIFETPMEENPLWSDSGVEEILRLKDSTGVGVSFVWCLTRKQKLHTDLGLMFCLCFKKTLFTSHSCQFF